MPGTPAGALPSFRARTTVTHRSPRPRAIVAQFCHLAGDYWVVRDRVESAGEHEVAVHFHFAPGLDSCVTPAATTDAAVADVVDRERNDRSLLRMAIFGRQGSAVVEDGWVSPQYGARELSRVLVWRQHGVGDQEVVTFLLPTHRTGDAEVRELSDVHGGRGFLVRTRGGDDLLLVGKGGGPLSARGVETDAAWLWLRRDSQGRVLEYRRGGRELRAFRRRYSVDGRRSSRLAGVGRSGSQRD